MRGGARLSSRISPLRHRGPPAGFNQTPGVIPRAADMMNATRNSNATPPRARRRVLGDMAPARGATSRMDWGASVMIVGAGPADRRALRAVGPAAPL